MELISSKVKIDFLKWSPLATLLSVILALFAVYQWVTLGSDKYGIDYLGGHEIVLKFENAVDSGQIRRALTRTGQENISVQSFEKGSNEFSIRVSTQGLKDDKALGEIQKSVLEAVKDLGPSSVVKTDSVGPSIGEELRNQAFLAILFSLIGMLIYITIRFETAYALGAVVALFHDVVVTIGIYLFVGHTINVSTLAAALTIVGYSVNDTIIVFDRVREIRRKSGDKIELRQLFNDSLNHTLSRTIITSLLTFFSALALLVLGGGALADLSLFLVVGLVAGTYSTIFIASPVAIWWLRRQRS